MVPQPPPVSPALRAVAAASSRLSDEALLSECEEEFFTADGPGGQHRNKSQTGVRLRHLPTGLVLTATERRSQAQNRGEALVRLRRRLERMSVVQRPRRKTRPTAGSVRRRADQKRRQSEKKKVRRTPDE